MTHSLNAPAVFVEPTAVQRRALLAEYGEIERFVYEEERAKLTGCCRMTAWRREKVNAFPRRRSISSQRCAWMLSDIFHWLHTRPIVANEIVMM